MFNFEALNSGRARYTHVFRRVGKDVSYGKKKTIFGFPSKFISIADRGFVSVGLGFRPGPRPSAAHLRGRSEDQILFD